MYNSLSMSLYMPWKSVKSVEFEPANSPLRGAVRRPERDVVELGFHHLHVCRAAFLRSSSAVDVFWARSKPEMVAQRLTIFRYAVISYHQTYQLCFWPSHVGPL